jgi:hypothetical protein
VFLLDAMAALPRKWVSDGAPTLGSTEARFVQIGRGIVSHAPNFSRKAACANAPKRIPPADNNDAVDVIASRLRRLHYLRQMVLRATLTLFHLTHEDDFFQITATTNQ